MQSKHAIHTHAIADRPEHSAIEEALQRLADRAGGLERLCSVAWSAGKHGEVDYAAWLDNTVAAVYRVRHKGQHKRAALSQARIIASTEGSKT